MSASSTAAPAPAAPPVDLSAYGTREPAGLDAAIIRLTRRMPEGWLGRRIAFALRKLVIRKLEGRPLDVAAFGARFRLYPFNNVCEKRILFTPQFFDPQERAAIHAEVDKAIAAGRPFRFVDVGANIGGYALSVAMRAQGRGKIIAVEPQPVVFDRLCFNIAANPGCGVKAIAAAITDQTGEATLFLDEKNRGEASVKVVGFEPGRGTSVTVPTKTLFGLLVEEGYSGLDALKLDVEGAEDLILVPFLRDAPQALWPRLLVLENPHGLWSTDLQKLLPEKGYVHDQSHKRNLVYRLPG